MNDYNVLWSRLKKYLEDKLEQEPEFKDSWQGGWESGIGDTIKAMDKIEEGFAV